VAYGGAVPVYDRNTAAWDWKGRIVATAGTIRAIEQSKWYPVVVDTIGGALADVVTHDVTITCSECRTIYVNGTTPGSGPMVRSTTTIPRTLLLFAGDVGVVATPSFDFIGGSADRRAPTPLPRTPRRSEDSGATTKRFSA
jgi:hypothetical protein